MAYRMYDIIEKKKHGGELTTREIGEVIRDYTAGKLPDYQMSALLMAIYFKGMTDRETLDLTMAMAKSGDEIDLSGIPGIKLDKHSTGGIGDKTTLVIGPVMAELGVPMAKMSGRGLGFTGGTIDKLESIPGLSSDLSDERFIEILRKVGFVDAGQTKSLAPADKMLYALRDVTATVDSIPLIASSIMSKKLAAGADRIVLDVKCGSGAFMQDIEGAVALAKQMIRIGQLAGRETVAVLSDMSQPLGRAVGNRIEVDEALEILSGGGEERLRELCIGLSVEMLQLSDRRKSSPEEARRAVEEVLQDGRAKKKFAQYVEMTGGDSTCLDRPGEEAAFRKELYPEKEGYLSACDAAKVGLAAGRLGAGRAKKEDVIDPLAGIRILARLGDKVEPDKPFAVLLTNKEESLPEAEQLLRSAYRISDSAPETSPVILKILRAE